MSNQLAYRQDGGDERDEETIDLREYVRIIASRKWSIIGLGFLFSLVAALAAYSMTPVYRSTATLLIEPPEANKTVSIEDVYGVRGDYRYYNTQNEILTSRALIEKVVDKLKLEQHPLFLPKKPDESRFNWRQFIADLLPKKEVAEADPADSAVARRRGLAGAVMGGLTIMPVKNSHLVNIAYESPDRHLAAIVANAVADAYIESDLEARLQMTSKASSWLTERLVALRDKLQESEQALQQYREQEQLVEAGGVGALTSMQLQDLGGKLVAIQERRANAEAIIRQIRALKGGATNNLAAIPAVLEDGLVASFKQAEAEAERLVSTLSERYGPKHPKMIRARTDLKEARANVASRIQSVIEGAEKNYQVALSNERSIQQALEEAKGAMQEINRKSYQLRVLEREVESNRQLYNMFLGRVKETKEAGGLEKANARISDPAVPASVPVKPNKKRIVVIAGLLGLLAGIALAFLLEHLDNTLKKGADLEERLGLPVLGALPRLDLKGKGEDGLLHYAREHRQSLFAESIRTIRTGILLSGLDDPHKVIVVTSCVPGEGKSTVAGSLADALGELHKVLLIDADMRRPTLAKKWGLKKDALGLSDYVSGTAKAQECIQQVEGSNVYVMSSGMVPPNPLELLSSRRFSEALAQLGQAFDHIILDSAPILAVSDSQVISSHASGVIFVVKADATPYPAAQEGVKRLRQGGAHLIGGVLNQVPLEKKGGYGKYGYYRGSYYGSYGYTSE